MDKEEIQLGSSNFDVEEFDVEDLEFEDEDFVVYSNHQAKAMM